MKIAALLLCALASPLAAQGVKDNSLWSDGRGGNVRVQVVDVDPTNPAVVVTFIDSSGFSGATDGTAASGSTSDKPKAKSSSEGTTTGGTRLRIRNGKTEKMVGGKWVVLKEVLKKPKKPKPSQRAVGVPLDEGGASLPQGGGPHPL